MALSEADTRAKLIDPAIKASGWLEESIRREVKVTNGRLYLVGQKAQSNAPLIADYILNYRGVPIAVVEAKDDQHHHAAGLQQSKTYAEMLDVKFAYSSNGKRFSEFDFIANTEKEFDLRAFPRPNELVNRLQHHGALPTVAEDPMLSPYNTVTGRQPRYYQDVAIRRALSAISGGDTRLLLTLATGTGKTYIASQITWKLYQTKRVKRVLFLADRVFLRDQAFNEFSFFRGPSGDPRYAVQDELSPHREIYFAIYQALFADRANRKLYQELPRDFFDLIVVDECHRSGFGTWREILDYFTDAIHLGLTATPKRSDNVDTYAYFGEPVYSYSLGQGIEDGFLATYKVHRVKTTVDMAGGIDVHDAVIAGADLFVPEGVEEVKDFYSIGEFERKIVLPDWTDRITDHLAKLLRRDNPWEKTLIFCVNMDHALEVRSRMQSAFADLGESNFAVRIVSEEHHIQGLLEDFRSSEARVPVIVTTVDLLSTGIDMPPVRNIVFIKPVGSAVVFKQIVGRGTRLDPATDKKWFRVIDYTNATRLFDEWDRPAGDSIELPPQPWRGAIRLQVIDAETTQPLQNPWAIAVAAPNRQVQLAPHGDDLVASELPELMVEVHVGAPNYRDRVVRLRATSLESAELAVVELRRIRETVERIVLKGVQVEIANEVVLTVDATGRQMTIDEYLAFARGVLKERVGSQGELRTEWLSDEARAGLLQDLESTGVHLRLIADLRDAHDADGYDVARHLAWSEPLVRREERAKAFLNHSSTWLSSFPPKRSEVLLELLDVYRDGGIDQLRRQAIGLDRFRRWGGPVGVIKIFGGSKPFDDSLAELRNRLYPVPSEQAA